MVADRWADCVDRGDQAGLKSAPSYSPLDHSGTPHQYVDIIDSSKALEASRANRLYGKGFEDFSMCHCKVIWTTTGVLEQISAQRHQ